MPSNSRAAREQTLWKIFESVRDQNPSKREAYSKVMAELQEEYENRRGNVGDLSKKLKSYRSKIMVLLFPKNERARKNLERELQNAIPFNQALLIARDRYETRAEIPVRRLNSPKTQSSPTIPLSELFALAVNIAARSGFSRKEVKQAFVEAENREFS